MLLDQSHLGHHEGLPAQDQTFVRSFKHFRTVYPEGELAEVIRARKVHTQGAGSSHGYTVDVQQVNFLRVVKRNLLSVLPVDRTKQIVSFAKITAFNIRFFLQGFNFIPKFKRADLYVAISFRIDGFTGEYDLTYVSGLGYQFMVNGVAFQVRTVTAQRTLGYPFEGLIK